MALKYVKKYSFVKILIFETLRPHKMIQTGKSPHKNGERFIPPAHWQYIACHTIEGEEAWRKAARPNTPTSKNVRPNTSRKVTSSAAFQKRPPRRVPGPLSTRTTAAAKNPALVVKIPRTARKNSAVNARKIKLIPVIQTGKSSV